MKLILLSIDAMFLYSNYFLMEIHSVKQIELYLLMFLLFPASPWRTFKKTEPPFKKRKVDPPQGILVDFHVIKKCAFSIWSLHRSVRSLKSL